MSASPALRQSLARLLFVALVALSWGLDGRRLTVESPGAGAPPFTLREVSGPLGLGFRHERASFDEKLAHIEAQIAALGAAVAVTDADADGLPDLYVTTSAFDRPNALFLNRGAQGFVDGAGPAGLADVNREGLGVSMGSVWADMDNDGDEDCFLYRYGYPSLYRNDGELVFTDVTRDSGLEHWVNANCALWFDADEDGLVDLFVAGYFPERFDLWNLETTRVMQDSFEFSNNGGSNRLYRNLGDGRFEEITEAAGLTSNRWTMGAAAADFDGDGHVDLYLANDYGAEEFHRNLGAGPDEGGPRFELVDAGLGDDSKSGMCVALGEVRNEGRMSVFVTNISERGYLFQGNNLRHDYLAEGAGFLNVAEGIVADCGWAWGAQFGDLDNDGWQDLFVANGFVTGDEGEGSYWYGMSKVGGAAGGLVEDAANWPPMWGKDLSGSERSRVLHNRGGRRFDDVAEAVGVTDRYDGRAVAMADLSGRGALDVIVANQRGPLLVYRAEPPPGQHWVQFELTGTVSNRSAIGAAVELKAGALHGLRVVDGGSGFSAQNGRRLHFGLGTQATLDEVIVHWPSGRRQVLHDLEVDRVHAITEPAS